MKNKLLATIWMSVVFASCGEGNGSPDKVSRLSVPLINYSVTGTFPHDTTAYTEGFVIHEGKLYESTGATSELPQTRSLFGTVDMKTGIIDVKAELDREQYFGEGIVFLKGKVYQLTYRTKKGFVYDSKSFQKLGEFTFPSQEGWGMTTDGTNLIMSDGTNSLTYLDPVNYRPVRTVSVVDHNGPVTNLNELEHIGGFIYANVYTTSLIVKIDPATGQVLGQLDLSSLVNEARSRYRGAMELNGIAYDSTGKKVYVTGKMWPTIYQVQFAH